MKERLKGRLLEVCLPAADRHWRSTDLAFPETKVEALTKPLFAFYAFRKCEA